MCIDLKKTISILDVADIESGNRCKLTFFGNELLDEGYECMRVSEYLLRTLIYLTKEQYVVLLYDQRGLSLQTGRCVRDECLYGKRVC